MSVSGQLIEALNSGELERLLIMFKSSELNQLINSNEAVHLVVEIATVFNECAQQLTGQTFDVLHTFDQLIYECCRLLRNSCAIGKAIQCQIAGIQFNTHSIYETINIVLLDVPNPQSILSQRTHKMCWQFVANLCVQNDTTQRHIWMECIAPLLPKINCICETENGHECTMILYNLFINDILSTNDVIRIVEILLQCILDQHDLRANDFHQLFMEYLLTKYRTIPMVCDRIAPAEKRIQLIYYAAEHLRAINHEPISTPLLQFVCKEFKKKSDCVLRATISSLDAIHPREVVALLDAIARASSDERYSHILAGDRSLFINIGCLLRSIHDVGRQQTNENDTNIFAPVQKLTQLAPNSSESSNIEREISYQLKSTLIRTLANLAYKNRDNQNLAREMDFIMAVLDSTVLDARNPLIKEWSILAIRNLCEGNMENQEIIRQLTKVGDSKSDIIKEFDLDLGSLRINPD